MTSKRVPKPKLNKWVAALLLALLSHGGVAHAAGLGKLNVLSRVGQPFSAEIELINVTRDDLGTLNVTLAPPAAYQAANLPYDPELKAVRLSVERRADGKLYVRATSPRPITEPFLHLLVDLTSQEGKLQRAYAALFDLPGLGESVITAPKPVTSAPAPKPDATPPRAPGASRTQKPSMAPDSAPAVAAVPAVPASGRAATAPAPAAPIRPPAAPITAPTATTPVPAVPAPAPIPATRAPATPAAAAAQSESRPVEPAKSEQPQAVPQKSEPVATEALRTEPPKPTEPPSVPAPESRATAPPKAIVPPPPPQRSVNNSATNPIVLIGGIALALLAGIVGLWALWRRKQAPEEANEPIAPTLGAETFKYRAAAAASPTAGANPVGAVPASVSAAIAATPDEVAQPGATVANVTDIVDPIDEAKVYLEYGQNEAAEKILREGLSKRPGREDIQMMLLEILAGRGDKDGFNQLAARLHKQTGSVGGNWKRAMAMGYALDPTYPLYSPPDDVAPQAAPGPAAIAADIDPGSPAPAPDSMSNTVDIHRYAGHANEGTKEATAGARDGEEPATTAAPPLPALDFELPPDRAPVPVAVSATSTSASGSTEPGLDFKIDLPTIKPKLEYEAEETTAAAADSDDPHREEVQQKIILARGYQEMGDKEGALELLREVEAEGDAAQQSVARKMLETLE